jgi:hypothetical protein
MNKVLTIVDTAGIQDYVFRTNKLRQIIGASTLVNNATGQWVTDVLKKPQDLVYSGGGNAVLIFDSMEDAKKFASDLSKITLEKAPGLRLVISHKEFNYNNDALGGSNGIINKTFEQLDRLKAEGNPWAYETSLGVTEECLFTGQPVVLESVAKSYDTLLSSEALAKQTAETDQLEKFSKEVDGKEYTFYFAEDMDHITGKNSDKNLIGIVHIDGNDIGTKIKELVNKYSFANANNELRDELAKFSDSVNAASEMTFDGLLVDIIRHLHGTSLQLSDGELNLYDKNGDVILPIRPIVLGGDDMTLICDGSLALDLTVRYLETAQTQELSDGSKYNCKAGVCIVKKNFPIYPAYQLSNQLAGSAKRFRQELKKKLDKYYKDNNVSPQSRLSAQDLPTIDWQICLNGIQGSLSDIRQTEYMGHDGKLYMRPLVIPDINDNCTWPDGTTYWRNWNQFMTLFDEMNNKKIISKNKAKELREHLRLSEEHIVNFLTLNGINLNNTYCNGWYDGRSPYFDALEIQDIFKKLAEEAYV